VCVLECECEGTAVRFRLTHTYVLAMALFRFLPIFQSKSRLANLAHEYGKVDGKIATVGITDFAQAALGDIVFVDLPEVGDEFEKGDSFGSVESVKAASDVYAPISGTITEINEVLGDEPGMVNSHAESDAWFVKIEMDDEGELDDLMDAGAYKEHCEKEAH